MRSILPLSFASLAIMGSAGCLVETGTHEELPGQLTEGDTQGPNAAPDPGDAKKSPADGPSHNRLSRPARIDNLSIQRIPGQELGYFELELPREDLLQLKTEASRVMGLNVQLAGEATSQDKAGKSVTFREMQGSTPQRSRIRALIPLAIKRVLEVFREFNAIQDRSLTIFSPGGHEVKARVQVPKLTIAHFLSGQRIDLPKLSQLGALASLGADTTPIDPARSLLLHHPSVIADPDRTMNPCARAETNNALKSWSFGRLINDMASGAGVRPTTMVRDWLSTWIQPQLVTDHRTGSFILDAVSDRSASAMRNLILNPWKARSAEAELDLRIAPFHLQAILYRPDLARSTPHERGHANHAGELRFVFGMMHIEDRNNDGDALDPEDICQPIEGALIFEYKVPLSKCKQSKRWANDWIALSGLPLGSAAHLEALENLTSQVTAGSAAPHRAFKSALSQIRSNEISLTGSNWQMREFVLDDDAGGLVQSTVKQTPRLHLFAETQSPQTPLPASLNADRLLLQEIRGNLDAILAGTYQVPEFSSSGEALLGGVSNYNIDTVWNHPALHSPKEREARFKFSVNTCSGCHSGETRTDFYHIEPQSPGQSPRLSPFLSEAGHRVRDIHGIRHEFDEMAHRRQSLVSLANQVCGFRSGLLPFQLGRSPLLSVH